VATGTKHICCHGIYYKGEVKHIVNSGESSVYRERLSELMEGFRPDFVKIEEALKEQFSSHIAFINEVSGHILFAGGKRLRPLLTVCAAKLCGRQEESLYELSAVPEYLHAASLLHDDVVDTGEMRRGKTPAYKVWGNSAAVLVGDFMYARAIELASRFGDVRIARAIAKTVALMAEGEIIQLLHAKVPSFDEKTYFDVVYRKTAALISTSCRIGALWAHASHEQTEAITMYGMNIGQAFQLVDDVLDYTAEADELGKAIGTDLAEGKLTLPIVVALEKASEDDNARLMALLRQGLPSTSDMEWVRSLLLSTGAIEYTSKKAEKLIEDACEQLDLFEKTELREQMRGLAYFVLQRRK
jgi:octaprenyl-diphosphate synthase